MGLGCRRLEAVPRRAAPACSFASRRGAKCVSARRPRADAHRPQGSEVMIMKKSTLLASVGAAALLSVACASTPEAAPAPAAEPAAEPAAAPAEGEKAPEGSCGGENKSEG
jgi:hypothetical protein